MILLLFILIIFCALNLSLVVWRFVAYNKDGEGDPGGLDDSRTVLTIKILWYGGILSYLLHIIVYAPAFNS